MKRHKSLIALSQDHHHGLHLAQIIKKDSPNYKGLPTELDDKIKYTINAWENELKLHFENEEEILFPFIAGRDEKIDNMIEEILIEHEEIRNKINQLENSTDVEETLNDLGNLLEQHIRKEERELFSLIQNAFNDNELEKLIDKIEPVKKK